MLGAFGLRAGRRAACALVVFGAVALSGPARSETFAVGVDQASLLKLPAEVSTIVIGNPLIADASLQRGGVLVITGKSFGSTNLMALDRTGSVVMERTIQVHAPADKNLVVVFRGVERESYSCAPNCERRIMLGDSVPFFNSALAQSGARTSAASPSQAR